MIFVWRKKYEESIAERVKTRRQNKETDRDTQRTFAPPSPPKEDYSAETDEYLKYLEEQEKDRKKFCDEYDSNGWSSGSGLKILTNKQILSRLPMLLARIQAGNNSTKLKNEIRQIIYSLYRSKVLTKTVYNNLIKLHDKIVMFTTFIKWKLSLRTLIIVKLVNHTDLNMI